MDDQDFFSHLYQVWSRTTGAQDRYYMPEAYEDHSGRWRIYAVGQDESRTLVADGLNEKDADFVTAVHGCLPDLIRRLTDAIDESDRLDEEKDTLIVRIAQLEMQVDSFRDQIEELQELLEAKEPKIAGLEAKLINERGWSAYLQCDVNERDAEIEDLHEQLAAREARIAELVDR